MNSINDCHIFRQIDKTNNNTDKNRKNSHNPQPDPWNLFPLSSGIGVFQLANQNPLDHQVAFQERAAPNMNLIQLKTKELLRCHCGWYGNQVSIAVRYASSLSCQESLTLNMNSIQLP